MTAPIDAALAKTGESSSVSLHHVLTQYLKESNAAFCQVSKRDRQNFRSPGGFKYHSMLGFGSSAMCLALTGLSQVDLLREFVCSFVTDRTISRCVRSSAI